VKAKDFIQTKQVLWARRNNIFLRTPNEKSELEMYTTKLEDNLYEPLDPVYEDQIKNGNGGELGTTQPNAAMKLSNGSNVPDHAAKMEALHSSSATGVNFFHYWAKRDLAKEIAIACRLCDKINKNTFKISFEEKFQIDQSFSISPNIDVVIKSDDQDQKLFAIECKFSEPYGSNHDGLSVQYIQKENLWKGILNLYDFAKTISPKDVQFKYLHPAQLIKHILGLINSCGKKGFKLLYLWYDVPGPEGCLHRQEIEKFSKITKKDDIAFSSITYQEVILNLYKDYYQNHNQYIDYLADRYL